MFGFDHPWFRPLPRRIGTVAVSVLWFAMEWRNQDPFWMILSGGVLALTFWSLILRYPKDDKGRGDE
jgi:hypothetical protein